MESSTPGNGSEELCNRRLRQSAHVSRGSRNSLRSGARSAQIFTTRRTGDLSIGIDQSPSEECGFHPAGELDAFERRIALMGFGFGSMNHKFGMWIDENDVGIVAGSDIAFAEQAKPLRRVPAQKLRHMIVRHAAPAALAQHAGE